MTFLAPLFLWLLPLALTPAIFHLFFRVRQQPRFFPSLMFFLAADPRLSTRRKLREWLLLALRCLVLASLLLALARPVRRGHSGSDVTMVAVVDNSASMSAGGRDGQSRLSRAAAAAAALISDPDVTLAGLETTVADPAAAPPAGLTADRAPLRAALAAVRATHASGDPARAIAAALSAVRGTMRGAGEVHVFTDLQATEWQATAAPLNLPPGISLSVHDVGGDGDSFGAIALSALEPPGRAPLAGRPWRVTARLRNDGDRDAEVTLNALIESTAERHRQAVTVPGQGERNVILTFRGGGSGLINLRCWLEGGAAAPAAEAWLAVTPDEGAAVWLLDSLSAHGLLGAALSPADAGALTGLRVTPHAAAGLAGELSGRPPAMIAATAAQLARVEVAEACRQHVAAGGTLLVTPDLTWPPPEVALPEWCGASWGAALSNDSGLAWVVLDPDSSLWDDLRDAAGNPLWRGVLATRAVPLRLKTARAVSGLSDGTPLMAATAVARGRVCVSGVAWHPRWSNLTGKAAFLALVQGLALSGTTDQRVERAVAGRLLESGAGGRDDDETTTVPKARRAPGGGEETVTEVRWLTGDTGNWKVSGTRLTAPPRAGVYELVQSNSVRRLAVAGEDREASPRRVRGDTVPLLARAPHRLVRDGNATAAAAAARAARQGRSLFGPLLLLAVAALVGEAAMAK
ncbi:MAG: BatA domain-containing protein [Kiritimatiellae bacterium]|nr:BatA domain-containing protein [Kiritimatiellia bacterium]